MFAEDLSLFFSLDEHAVAAVITLSNNTQLTVNVIFNSQTAENRFLDTGIVSESPNLIAATSDLTGVRKNDYVFVEGESRKIEKILHDGTGMSTVYLFG